MWKSSYLNTDMCRCESSQEDQDESRVQLADYSTACSKPKAFLC